MPAVRLRFSLKALLVATTVVAVVTYWCLLPTARAKRFVRHVHDREQVAAMAMLSNSFELRYRSILWIPHTISIEPATWADWLLGRRTVAVTSHGERVQFIVTPLTIYRGKNSAVGGHF
jgi:hypothetical protein